MSRRNIQLREHISRVRYLAQIYRDFWVGFEQTTACAFVEVAAVIPTAEWERWVREGQSFLTDVLLRLSRAEEDLSRE